MDPKKGRLIIVPKDKEAEKAFDYNLATEDQLILIALSDHEMERLFIAGVFDLINNISGSIIDQYELDEVTDQESIRQVIKALKIKQESFEEDIAYFVKEIIKLFEEASKRGTGVYFNF